MSVSRQRLLLALRAVKAAALTYSDLLDGRVACVTSQAFTAIDTQCLLEIARLAVATNKIAQRGSAHCD